MESIKETELNLQREVVTTVPNTWLVEAVNPSTGEKKMIDIANYASVVAGQIGTNNSGSNSLLTANTHVATNRSSSTLLFHTTTKIQFMVSCLVVDSYATGYTSNMYILNISRTAAGVLNTSLKVIFGDKTHPIKYKLYENGTLDVVLYRSNYSPLISCLVLAGQFYIEKFMTSISDSLIDDTYIDFTVVE